MTNTWMKAIDKCSASALASGDLQPVQVEQVDMEDAGMRFVVRWVSSLAVKDAAKVSEPADDPGESAIQLTNNAAGRDAWTTENVLSF